MKLAAVATVIFIAGLFPGLARSIGPLPDAPRRQQSVMIKPAHPALVKVADLLRLRL